jgi:hypothetical protein
MADEQQARWVTIADAARLLGKNERTIRRMMASGRLANDRTGPLIRVDIGPHMTGEVSGLDVTVLVAENERLKAVLEEIRAERDYLRQVHAMALTLTKQIEALRTERRAWWRFWEADAGQ